MHNELFNETGIHTYYGKCLQKWNYAKRDFYPEIFLNDMMNSSDKYGRPNAVTKAVGFKSFPEHYMDYGAINFKLFEVFSKMMDDYYFKKVILYRDNVFKVFLSMNRSFITGHYLTKNYDDVKITVDIPSLQKFIDRYLDAYKKYHEMTRGQSIFHMSYEDLTGPAQEDVLKKLFRFLGVSIETPKPLIENIPQSSQPLSKSILNYAELEFAWRHTNLSQFLDSDYVAAKQSTGDSRKEVVSSATTINTDNRDHLLKWALLIPICSRDSTADQCRERLETLNASLLATLAANEYKAVECVFGIDLGDELYDTTAGKDLLLGVFSHFKVTIRTIVGLEGKVCRIWNELADYAFAEDAAFMVLLGDDVTLQTPGWKAGVEATFQTLSQETSLPYGAACVAFRDISFLGFPTFPVIHRFHMEVFGRMIPYQFINQGGDPYLFALYHRYDTPVFADFSLMNGIGGSLETARYTKNHIRWKNEILSSGLEVLQKSLARPYYKAVDIVVPTFRCDVETLRSIVSLRSRTEARVSFWIIVDNPTSAHLEAVKGLEKFERNYSVRVRVHTANLGASMARNTGMDYSDADYIVFLDDDVVPDCCLIDAYLGAIMRYPDAGVFVGSTHLPAPSNYLTHAYVTSDLIGSYTVAEKRRDPAWGVTANLCVKGRSNRVRFQKEYPKTGGGEDIDYCLRVGRGKAGSVVAVPGAKASHPWWSGGDTGSLFHILGWARGESLCLESDALKDYVYFTGPNGTELCMVLAFSFVMSFVVGFPLPFSSFRCFFLAELGIFTLETGWHCRHVHHRVPQPAKKFIARRVAISVLAAWVIMYQEAGRMVAHLRRGKLMNLFWRLDWVCGKNPEYIAKNRVHVILKSTLYLALIGYLCIQERNELSVCNTPPAYER